MKTKLRLFGLVAAVMTLGITTINAQAINSERAERINQAEDKKTAIENKKTEKICSRIDSVLTRLEAKIGKTNGEDKLKERVQTRTMEMEENRIKRDADLKERRAIRDENRDEFYDELEVKAGDDAAKKAAVERFRAAVEAAIKTRREAIDNAKNILNDGIDKSIATREASVKTLRAEFKNEVNAAISKTKNSCAQDATSDDLKSVMTQLKNDIKTARDKYKAKVSEVKKVQETIRALRETRKASVKLAIENFKAEMKIAQEALRVAMGE